jgi:hypothetical protein
MSKEDRRSTGARRPQRRPYQRPAFDSALAFERVSLGCGQPLNLDATPPPFGPGCALSSS